MIKRASILLTAAVAFAVVVAGCGGSSSSGGATTAAGPPGPQLVRQARTICVHANEGLSENIEAYERQHEKSPEKVEGEVLARATDAAMRPRIEQEIEEIGATASKAGEEAQIAPYLEALESGLAADQEPTTLEQIAQDFKQADNLGAKYGLKGCLI